MKPILPLYFICYSISFYLPHVKFEGSIGFVSRRIKKNQMRKSGAWILSTYCKLYVRDLQTSKFVWKDPSDFQISKFWVHSFIPGPQISEQKCHQIYSTVKFVEQSFHFPIRCPGSSVVSAPDFWPRRTGFESRINHGCFSCFMLSLCIICWKNVS
jgi:hypothetical protein